MNLESVKLQTLSGNTFEFRDITCVSYTLSSDLKMTRGILDTPEPSVTSIEIGGVDYSFKCNEISYLEIRTDVRTEKYTNGKVEVEDTL